MIVLACALFLLGGILASPLLAQRPAVSEGVRIRVRPAGANRWTIGTLDSLTADSLFVSTGGGTMAVGRSRNTSAELSWGRKRNTLKGALYGGAILGAIGAGLGAAFAAWEETEDGDLGIIEGASIVGGVGALGGGLIGAGIGTFIRTERWQAVETESLRLALSVSPAPGGIRVGISASF